MNRPSPPDGVHLQEVGDEQQEFQPEIETGGHHTFEDLRIQHHDGAQYNAQYSIQHSQTHGPCPFFPQAKGHDAFETEKENEQKA